MPQKKRGQMEGFSRNKELPGKTDWPTHTELDPHESVGAFSKDGSRRLPGMPGLDEYGGGYSGVVLGEAKKIMNGKI